MPSKKLGALNTGGLLDIIDNPYYEMSKEELGAGWDISEKREITRQELLEKKHGRPRGFTLISLTARLRKRKERTCKIQDTVK